LVKGDKNQTKKKEKKGRRWKERRQEQEVVGGSRARREEQRTTTRQDSKAVQQQRRPALPLCLLALLVSFLLAATVTCQSHRICVVMTCQSSPRLSALLLLAVFVERSLSRFAQLYWPG